MDWEKVSQGFDEIQKHLPLIQQVFERAAEVQYAAEDGESGLIDCGSPEMAVIVAETIEDYKETLPVGVIITVEEQYIRVQPVRIHSPLPPSRPSPLAERCSTL